MLKLCSSRTAALFAVLLSACQTDNPVTPIDATAVNADDLRIFSSTASTGTTVSLVVADWVDFQASSKLKRSKVLTWVSSNPAVARVSATGRVTGVGAGTASITASSTSGSERTPLRVYLAPVSIIPSPSTIVTSAGGRVQLASTVRAADSTLLSFHPVAYRSSNSSIALVSATGLVTAVAGGSTTVVISDGSSQALVPVTVTGPAVDPALPTFSLSPRTLAVQTGRTQQFSVTWSDGLDRSACVTYSATGGTITVNGLYTAGQVAGAFLVIASCNIGARADTARLTVAASNATLSSIAISPKALDIGPSGTRQFTAQGSWSDGSIGTAPAVFTANGGSISSSGAYTASSTPGVFTVVATASGGALSDTSFVTVTAGGAVTPFFQDNFDTGSRTNSNGFSWATSTATVTVSRENTFSGGYALNFEFGPNAPGADSWAEQRFDMGRYLGEVWIEYQLWIPLNFSHRNDQPSNNKFLAMWRDVYFDYTGGTWGAVFEYQRATTDSADVSRLRFTSSRWDMRDETDLGLRIQGQGAPFIGGTGPIKIGSWNRIRIHLRAASSRAASDGVAQMWANQTLLLDDQQGRFHNFFDTPADAVLRNGYLLGWANSGFTERTVFAIDDVKFYNSNPGW